MPNVTRDVYNPVPSVAPEVSSPNDSLSVRANPTQFGGQVGQSVEKLGQTGTELGNQGVDLAIQQQGMLNEHTANMADMTLATEGGKIYDKYKTLEGLDAATQKDKYVADYMNLYTQIGSQMNPAARKAFEQTAARRASFTIQDMNSYAADQTRQAYRTGNSAAMNLSIDSTARYNVATDNSQFNFEAGSIISQVNAAYTAPEWGKYQSVNVKESGTGRLVFDQSTDEGRVAQNDYDYYLNEAIGKAWDNRLTTIATDPMHGNPILATQMLEDNKDRIPAKTYASLAAKLQGPYSQEQARIGVQTVASHASADFLASNQETSQSAPSPNSIGNVKTKEGDYAAPATPFDGVVLASNNLRGGLYKGLTLSEIGKKWTGEGPDKVAAWVKNVHGATGIDPNAVPDLDNPEVVKKLMHGIGVAEKNENDMKAFTPEAIALGVDASFSGQKANLTTPTSTTVTKNPNRTYANYMGVNANKYIQQVRDWAKDQGLDVTKQDLAASRMENYISELNTQQRYEQHAYRDQVLGAVLDEKHPITDVNQLTNNPDPGIRDAWLKLQMDNPYAYHTVQQLVTAHVKGKSHTYGSNMYSGLSQILSGKITEPEDLSQLGIGDDRAPISDKGFVVLQKELEQAKADPGFAHAELQFLNKAQQSITGSGFPGIDGAKRQPVFEKWLMTALPQIQADRAAGKSFGEIFGDKNSSVVKMVEQSAISPAALKQEAGSEALYHVMNPPPAAKPAPFDPNTIKTKEDLFKNAGKLTRKQFDDIAVKNHWARVVDAGPQVPLPEGWKH